jgi:pyruvate formate lyase activating enzyme
MAIIFNIQRFSIQDGPGIRTTVFIKGCPLRCLWCSNPESQNAFLELGHRNSLCKKCGKCVEVCKVGAISVGDEGIKIDRKTCTVCGKCVEVCKPEALKFYGKEMTVDEVFKEVERDSPFYDNSGGGVTISGGEPLSQPDYVGALLKKCQLAGIHTCIETCGYVDDPDVWKKVLPYLDLVLIDIKLYDSTAHKRATGKPNEKILNSIKIVAESGVPAIIRIPVIPGINDSEENMKNTALYIKSLNTLNKVELLPYHRFGESKYAMLDRKYSLGELRTQKDGRVHELVEIFKSSGLDCTITV